MKFNIFTWLTVALATVSLFFVACDDEISGIGNSISSSEVTINVDSIFYKLEAKTIPAPKIESRSSYMLLGSVRVPEYGALDCSYVTQFLPAESLNLPDTISSENIDSVKLILTVPKRYITGDSLAPQQMKVFSLTKPLPSGISSDFDPAGYYNAASPLSIQSYNLSGYSFNDSVFINSSSVQIKAPLPVEIGRKAVEAYKNDPDIFIWPESFARFWPGIFVEPSFGKGCIAPVQNTGVYAYFPKSVATTVKDDDGENKIEYKIVADSVCLFSSAPEVLSNVNISYSPSEYLQNMIKEGKSIITTPGGFTVAFTFPAVDILKKYWDQEYDLGVINNMIFSIPAKIVTNQYGLGLTPALLMVKSSEVNSFFSEGRLPDNISSFTSLYSAEEGAFVFSSMRQYIVGLREKGEENITQEDVEFTLIPVTVSTEEYTDPTNGQTVTAVTDVAPFIMMPTMGELDTQNARIVFTYSNQTLF